MALPGNVHLILAVTLVYRVATSMGPLAILLTLTDKLSLPLASFALTGWTLAGALSQPLWIWVAKHVGWRLVLSVLGLTTFFAHAGIGVVESKVAAVAISTLAGATLPPITAQARALLASLLNGARLRAAFDTEAALASSAFVVAPLVVALTNAVESGAAISCAALLGLTSLIFAQVGRRVAHKLEKIQEPATRKPGRRINWLTVTLIVSGAAAYGMLACIEVVVVARVADRATTALLLSAWAGTSLAGGLVLSRLNNADRLRWALLPVPTVACAVMAGFTTSNLSTFSAILIISGISVAPTMALLASEIARVTPSSEHAAAYGWLQASSWLGSAVATAIAGPLASKSLALLLFLAASLAAASAVLIYICRWRGSRSCD